MNEVVKSLVERRSIRSYKKEQIKDSELDEILKAGMYSASGMNRQCAVIVAVQNEKTIDRMGKIKNKVMGTDKDPFYGAPTVLVVLVDKTMFTCVEDGSLVMGNLMNAAHAVGVDSCWIHRAKEIFEDEDGKALLREWGLDSEKYMGVGNCILGYRNCEYPDAPPRKDGWVIKVK